MYQIDAARYKVTTNSTVNYFVKFFNTPGYRFMVLFRTCQRYRLSNPLGFFARIWYKRMQVKYGYQIPHSCMIGKGLFLGHYGNIVVNQNTIIGENCNIAQGVTIGHVSRGKKIGSPIIGDRVWIGANAVIVGNINVGNDVLIAPLSFVNFDIPDKAVVVGNPAQIVSWSSSEGYIKNI